MLFGSEGCEECAEIKSLWSQQKIEDQPVLIYVSIDKDENYAFLKQVEHTLGIRRPGSAFPIILAGKKMVQGVEGFTQIYPQLDELLEKLPSQPMFQPIQAMADSCKGNFAEWNAEAEIAAPSQAQVPNQANLRLLYLYSPGCRKCARLEVELKLLKKLRPDLQLDSFQVNTDEGMMQMQRVIQRFDIKAQGKNLAPLLAWNDAYISGRLADANELKDIQATGEKCFWEAPFSKEEQDALRKSQKRFLSNMTWTNAVLAGLGDGINPCAFATVIFLISYLLMLKRSRRFILATGFCFCLGVFSSYFLFGLGLSFIVDYLNNFRYVKMVLYLAFAVTGLVFAILHFRDAWRYKHSGNVEDMDMRLDSNTHRKIHQRIRNWSRLSTWIIWPAAIGLGVVISSLEFVCTGQIYLPTIMAIASNGFSSKVIAGLLVYNIAFILPLIVVTLLAYAGTDAKTIGNFAQKHLVATKTIMAIMFLLLAVLMAAMALF
ncbi:MAG: hypothetical protein IKS20_04215 [Victivallales bacterium]|nr:hypothetical protein [Victivallales bacterium]